MGRPANEDISITENFVKSLNDFLDSSEYNNTTFGKAIGVSETTIRKYRNGTILPSHTTMTKILNIMHKRYHTVLGVKDPEASEK
ncbi:MAG: helix-turn-helix domain-containing protein [Anaeroplasma sp.]|nr:helix-turn-helix domain-containing protein [Anaeroplasma sp.]